MSAGESPTVALSHAASSREVQSSSVSCSARSHSCSSSTSPRYPAVMAGLTHQNDHRANQLVEVPSPPPIFFGPELSSSSVASTRA